MIYAGGESETAKDLIAERADAYVMHGDPPERLAPKIADMAERRERLAPTSRRCSSAWPALSCVATRKRRRGARWTGSRT